MDKIDIFAKEIAYIKDKDVKRAVESLLPQVPDYFYIIEASSTGKYHPEYASGEKGLVRHTKAVVRMAYELFGIYKFDEHTKDLIIMACIFHDSLKKGNPEQKYTLHDHPIQASNFIKEHAKETKLSKEDIEFVCGCIESHMGRWNTSEYSDIILPLPKTPEQKFVHMCDYLASRKVIHLNFDEQNNIVD